MFILLYAIQTTIGQVCAEQKVLFDWTADITGTGARLEYIVESNWNVLLRYGYRGI